MRGKGKNKKRPIQKSKTDNQGDETDKIDLINDDTIQKRKEIDIQIGKLDDIKSESEHQENNDSEHKSDKEDNRNLTVILEKESVNEEEKSQNDEKISANIDK
jgi:hypothetical protein